MTLFTVYYVTLSVEDGVRNYIRAEGLWAKAQKDAVISLEHYIQNHDQSELQSFNESIKVIKGYKTARLALSRETVDIMAARQGFLAGGTRPVEIDSMINLFVNFQGFSYMEQAIEIWALADYEIENLEHLADAINKETTTSKNKTHIQSLHDKVSEINSKLNHLEHQFSDILGEGARWIHRVSLFAFGIISFILIFLGLVISRKILQQVSDYNIQLDANKNYRNINELRLKKLLELSRKSNLYSEKELCGFALDIAVEVTNSKEGYLHILNENQKDITLVTWNRTALENCTAATDSHYPIDHAGIWADSARLRKVVVHNDYRNAPGRKGVPDGHFPITRHMSAPGIYDNKVNIIVGVGNKLNDYDEQDKRQLELVADEIQKLINRKRLDQALRESSNRFFDIVNLTSDMICEIDLKGNLSYVSIGVQKVLGYLPEDLIGRKSCFDLIGQDSYRKYRYYTRAGKKFYNFNHFATHKDGHEIYMESSGSPVFDHQGKVVGFRCSSHDVSEKRELEMQLRQAQKMESIGTLTGGIAHDFNNILGSILGYNELAMEEDNDKAKIKSYLEQIQIAGNRAKNLVSQLLSFSRQTKEENRPMKVAPLIKESAKLLRSSVPANIAIDTVIKEPDCFIIGNPTGIHQIIINLCSNASSALEETGGIIDITLESILITNEPSHIKSLAPGRYVCLKISDNGPGIHHKHLDKIFDPFFTTKDVGKGTGLGLSVVHGIVKSYGGQITVKTELGVGTVFCIYFKQVYVDIEEVTTFGNQDIISGAGTVMLVDDEQTLVNLMAMQLSSMGFNSLSFTDPLEALARFKEDPDKFDLVISDQAMPNITGLDMARTILSIRPELPIILCTGFSQTLTKEKATEIGVREMLIKPISKSDLSKAIGRVLPVKKISS
ncbi:MAG: response regulator [Magnetococcales bacterium]|nr:response regulator [Magnetococcales bacterium]